MTSGPMTFSSVFLKVKKEEGFIISEETLAKKLEMGQEDRESNFGFCAPHTTVASEPQAQSRSKTLLSRHPGLFSLDMRVQLRLAGWKRSERVTGHRRSDVYTSGR